MLHLSEWAGCCDELVDLLLATGEVIGARRDGVWKGRHASNWGWKSHDGWRRDSKGYPMHSWIEQADGTIVDPTRWVFEGVLPYIYRGLSDFYEPAK